MIAENRYNPSVLSNQISFPLYAVSKEVVRLYTPLLEGLDLTYTQYISMMVIWEEGEISVKDLGSRLFLDSGTLTPLLKKLEAKGYIVRTRSTEDERCVTVSATPMGLELRERAASIPEDIKNVINLPEEDCEKLYQLLDKVLEGLKR